MRQVISRPPTAGERKREMEREGGRAKREGHREREQNQTRREKGRGGMEGRKVVEKHMGRQVYFFVVD